MAAKKQVRRGKGAGTYPKGGPGLAAGDAAAKGAIVRQKPVNLGIPSLGLDID
jgi:hypothetical protein